MSILEGDGVAARSRVAIATLGLLAFLLLQPACGGTGGSQGSSRDGLPSASEVEARLFDLTNGSRAENGISPQLRFDSELSDIARKHSEAMRDQGFFGHEEPSGQTFQDRLVSAGIVFTTAGENLAMVSGATDPAGFAHDKLMQSDEHRVNILSQSFTRVGIGVAVSGATYWITEDFADL